MRPRHAALAHVRDSSPEPSTDLRALAMQLHMARNAEYEQEQDVKHRALRLATALGVVAGVFAIYDVVLLATAMPH